MGKKTEMPGESVSFGKELIIPDIHLKWACANRIIELEQPDRIWFMGDYFDDFDDSIYQMEETCRWLRGLCDDSRVHLLLGNHDIYYFCENKAYRGAGYTRYKRYVAQRYFSPEIVREKFRLHARTGGYLLSHAGFSGRWLGKYSVELLDRHFEAAFQSMLRHEVHPLLGIGEDRGGDNALGGVTWCDWRNFDPIAGLPQIVGHTFARQVRWASIEPPDEANANFRQCIEGTLDDSDENSFLPQDDVSLCLDTNLRHYAVIEPSGRLQVKRTPKSFLAC